MNFNSIQKSFSGDILTQDEINYFDELFYKYNRRITPIDYWSAPPIPYNYGVITNNPFYKKSFTYREYQNWFFISPKFTWKEYSKYKKKLY